MVLNWLHRYLRRRIERDPDFVEAREWGRSFQPTESRSYEWAIEYGMTELARLEDDRKVIEAKADSLIGYLGTVTGIIALLAGLETKPAGLEFHPWHLYPPLVAFVFAILLALIARMPVPLPGIPTTRAAFEAVGESHQETAAAAIVGAKVHAVVAALRVDIRSKASMVQRALLIFFVGLAWLALQPIVARLL